MSTFDQQAIQTIADWLGTGSINIFGMPFAGKDTQGNILADLLDAPLLGGGDILRGSVIPEHVRESMHSGALIPTEDYVKIVLPYLSQSDFAGKPLILSSVGRWAGEEPSVLAATEQSGHPMKAVFYLEISEKVARERHRESQSERSKGSRGERGDDTAEVFKVRLREFREKTLPVIDYYKQMPLFCRIDAVQHSAKVTAQILENLLARATPSSAS
jgi:adenylate kinase